MKPFELEIKDGVVISSDLKEKDLQLLEGIEKRDMGNGYVWHSFSSSVSGSGHMAVQLCFLNGTLDSVHCALIDPDKYGKDWNDWSEEKENQRAKDTEKWLRDIGYPVGNYPWGNIWAGFDAKGGTGSAIIRFAL